MRKWGNIKDFNFPSYCLVGGMKKWSDEKKFCLVEKKNEKVEIIDYINLFSCPSRYSNLKKYISY